MRLKNITVSLRALGWSMIVAVLLVSCGDTDNSSTVNIPEIKTSPGKDAKIPADKQFTLMPDSYTGLSFANKLGEDIHGSYNVIAFTYYYNGAGIATGDVNNDGLPDVFVTGNTVPNRLYLNKGDMQFEDISEKAGVLSEHWSTGVTMVDINNDGYLDIYVCRAGPNKVAKNRSNLMYINNGDLTFTEKAAEMGIDDTNHSTHASFFDYDKDGDFDLYVADYSLYSNMDINLVMKEVQNEKKLRAASGKLYRNDDGKFTDVSKSAGVLNYGYGLGLVTSDFNHDGWIDIYVANDFTVPDFMYINNGDGTFTDRTNDMTKQISYDGMGCDISDFNNDGKVDIAVVDMTETDHVRNKTTMANMDTRAFWSYVNGLNYQHQYMFNTLQLNRGNETFSNVAFATGLGSTDWSWSPLFADLDNDGWKDFYVTNGYRRYANDKDFKNELKANTKTLTKELREEFYAKIPQYKLSNYVYRNTKDLSFTDETKDWGMNHPSYSNGASYADLDNDGDLDILVSNIDAKTFVYRNNSNLKDNNNFLRVKPVGKNAARIANAKVSVYAGEQIQFQEYAASRGYQSSVEHVLHFGLAKETSVDSVKVEWLSGKTQVLKNVEANQILVLDEADASKANKRSTPEPTILTQVKANKKGIDYIHKENDYNDFEIEVLLPHKQSSLGPFAGVGDVNKDGLDDIYFGGAAGQAGELYIQNTSGTYKKVKGPWQADKDSEDMSSLFFDADGDGDMDLYVASGGSADVTKTSLYQDRLYLNQGETFVKAKSWLPKMLSSTLRVKALDYDNDGDQDLIVGGRLTPEKYPYPSRTYLLENTGKSFKDVTSKSPDMMAPGLINDILCTDFNKDGKTDIVMAGEWTGILFFQNNGKSFKDVSKQYMDDSHNGWWYSLALHDIDGDGDEDIIAGNLGLNNKFHASKKKPLNLYSNDFDKNGTCDVVLGKYYKGKEVPVRGKQCSTEQMPFISEKFPSFHEFANASLDEMYGDQLGSALHLQVKDFKSYVFLNNDGKYEAIALPMEAQLAPINGMIIKDWTGNGYPDILLAGNMHHVEVETPRYDAGVGLLLEGDGTGAFKAVHMSKTGFYAPNDAKDIKYVRGADADKVIVLNNDKHIQLFEMKKDKAMTMR